MNILEKADQFVFSLLKNELPNACIYHNYKHAKRVLKSTNEILENMTLGKDDILALRLAALFHDTGHIKGKDDHEKVSVQIAKEFLIGEKIEPSVIDIVETCILATKFEYEPSSQVESIIKDADTAHFGKKRFAKSSEFLRKELELRDGIVYSPSEWQHENVTMLAKKHTFFTDYALKNWQSRKDKNLLSLIEGDVKKKKKLSKEKSKAKFKAKFKNESPDRGIQTFYRVTLRNHIKLSDIADTKANILLSVNAIIISLVISNLISKLDNPSNDYLIIPTIIFTLFSVASMILSILATRPNITRGEFTKEDIKNKKVNLAFFGNFHKMDLTVFENSIKEIFVDKDYLYSCLTKDLYFLGKVLDTKYRLLRITYTVFMIGMIVSLIAFALSFKSQTVV